MPPSIPSPSFHLPIKPLTAEAFAPFGTVVQNPLHNQPKDSSIPVPPNAVYANQGSALKILDVTHMTDFYTEALSKQPSKAVMNMFVCSPRELRSVGEERTVSGKPVSFGAAFGNGESPKKHECLFDVKILERHPYTSQTFVPMGLDEKDETTCYLVIVAPTLPDEGSQANNTDTWKRPIDNFLNRAAASLSRASPAPHSLSIESGQRKGTGQPDLNNICAFLANGSQAVTYGAGTWHAPMVVLGLKKVEFVVVQFANGVGEEDCQERELKTVEGVEGIAVVVKVADDPLEKELKARL